MSDLDTRPDPALLKPAPFAEAFTIAGPAERQRMVDQLVDGTNRLLLVGRARQVAGKLKSRGAPFVTVYDFEILLASRLHPGSDRHRGADYFLDSYYRQRVEPYRREIRRLEKEGALTNEDIVPVLAEIDRADGTPLVRLFLERSLRPRYPDSAELLRAVEDGVVAARREDDVGAALEEEHRRLNADRGPGAANMLRMRAEYDDVLRPHVGRLVEVDETDDGQEDETADGGDDAGTARDSPVVAIENKAPAVATEDESPAAERSGAPVAASVANRDPAAQSAAPRRPNEDQLNALYGWALKHIKQFEERFESDEDRAALAGRILNLFRKLDHERGHVPALATLDRVLEGAEAARLLPDTVAILQKLKDSGRPGANQEPEPPATKTSQPEFEDASDEPADGGSDEADENDTPVDVAEEQVESEAESEAVEPEFEEVVEEAPGATTGEGDGFPPEPSERDQFLAERLEELVELERELRLELDDIERQADAVVDSEPDEVRAARAIEALGDPRFAPHRDRLLAELEEADDLFRRIMGLLSDLSRRLTIQELRTFVDGLIGELQENEELTDEHPHLIERLTNYRNSLQDDPPELLREIHGKLDEIRRSRPDYIPDQLAFLKERLEDASYRKLWPTIFNIYQNILQQQLDLTLSGIARRPAAEQLEMYGALKQGFAPGSPVFRELDGRLRGAELSGVSERLQRERAGEEPSMESLAATLGSDPMASIKAEIQSYDADQQRERRKRSAALTSFETPVEEKEQLLAALRESEDPAERAEYILHQLGEHAGAPRDRLKALDALEGSVDQLSLETRRAAIRLEAGGARAAGHLIRLLGENDPDKRRALTGAVAADPDIPAALKDALLSGGDGAGQGFEEAFEAIMTSPHAPANKLKFLKALANIARARGWLDAARAARLRQALARYEAIVATRGEDERDHRARNHYYFARRDSIADRIAAGDDRAVLDDEQEHVHDYNQAQQAIQLAGTLGVRDTGGLPPFLREAIPANFKGQADTILSKKGRAVAPADQEREDEFRRELEALPFPAGRAQLKRLFQKYDDPRRRQILNQMNALSREREKRQVSAPGAPSRSATSSQTPMRSSRAGTISTKRTPTGSSAAPTAAKPPATSALDSMLDSALRNDSAMIDMEVDDFDPGIKVKHSLPGADALAGPTAGGLEKALPTSPGDARTSAPTGGIDTTSAPKDSPAGSPAAPADTSAPEFVSVAPEFEPGPKAKKKRRSDPNHETRAPSWDERIAGSLSKLGGTLRQSLSAASSGRKSKEPRSQKSEDWKTFSVSKLGAKATKDFYDFSGKKKAEDIYAKLLTQEDLINRIKSMPEFQQAQQDPKKVDQIAESVKNSIAVTVVTPRDVRPIGFPETLCFPRKDWFDDLKRKRLIKATREMAKKNNPGSERHNYYLWLADEIEMRYYQSKYKRGKLD